MKSTEIYFTVNRESQIQRISVKKLLRNHCKLKDWFYEISSSFAVLYLYLCWTTWKDDIANHRLTIELSTLKLNFKFRMFLFNGQLIQMVSVVLVSFENIPERIAQRFDFWWACCILDVLAHDMGFPSLSHSSFIKANPQWFIGNNLIRASKRKVINGQSNHVNLLGVIFDGQTVINVEHLMAAVLQTTP